jgi:hypothetical protein
MKKRYTQSNYTRIGSGYVHYYEVFWDWHERGLVEATRLGSFPDDLDKLIAEALGLPLDAEQLDQWCHETKDHWLLGPHAYALYRLTLQRKQCNHSGISGP